MLADVSHFQLVAASQWSVEAYRVPAECQSRNHAVSNWLFQHLEVFRGFSSPYQFSSSSSFVFPRRAKLGQLNM